VVLITACFLAATLNAIEIPPPAPKEKWVRATSPHFTIVSSAGEGETRQMASDLETLAATLQRLHPRFREVPLTRSRVLLFQRRGEAQPYFDLLIARGTRAPGAFVNGDSGGTMVLSAMRKPDRTPYHELVHNLMAGRVRPPLWLEEGWAEYYSYADLRGTKMRVGAPWRHVAWMRKRGILPMRQILDVGRGKPLESRFYAEAWGAVDWLLHTDRAAFDAFEADIESGVDVETALHKHYKVSMERWEQGLAGAGRNSPFVIDTPRVETAVTVERLPHAEVLFELGSFLGEFDATRDDAERHFRAALEADPRHARSLAGLGRILAKSHDLIRAISFFDHAVSISPDDPAVLLAYAEALIGDAIGPAAGSLPADDDAAIRFRKARDLAQHALDHGADEARARSDIAISWTIEPDQTQAIAALEAARLLAPRRRDLALNLYAIYLRSGQREKANALFAGEFEQSRDGQVIFAAKSVLLRELTTKANALVAEQKLVEAVPIVYEIATLTADETARQDIEKQAAQLEKTIELNRQIAEYNKAIEELKQGDRKAALQRIDALLVVATDKEVIQDAQDLRQELLRR
jgi:Flp pilus assembly protein TadD